MPTFPDRCVAALAAGAIGDAMGAPVEGRDPARVAELLAGAALDRFPPPNEFDPDGSYWKGNGRITDDTLMVEALIDGYAAAKRHLDAHDWDRFVMPNVCSRFVFVPERQRDMRIIDRLHWPEKYPYLRLRLGNVDPRSSGVGNVVNCGVAMYAWPTGALHRGDPQGAYEEACAWAVAHNESYAVEAAGGMAAAAAAALSGDRTDAMIAAARDTTRDGTPRAIAAAAAAADPALTLAEVIPRIRAAVALFDPRPAHATDTAIPGEPMPSDTGRPSRLSAIEELPVALAALRWGDGSWAQTLDLAVRYGRDCDSIAGMAMSLFGAQHGLGAVPPALIDASQRINHRDWAVLGRRLATVADTVFAADSARWRARAAAHAAG